MPVKSVKSALQQLAPGMTAAERRIATVVLADFPFSGLGTIQELAAKAKVSAPSITRFVSKLDYAGYQEFQRQLIEELKESARSPVDLRGPRPQPQQGFLADYFRRVAERTADAAESVSDEEFQAFCALLGDPSRSVFIIGGRVSHGLASVMATSLQFLRADVQLMPSDPEQWPEYLQRMKKRDVLVMIDFRRYQKSLERLAEVATTQAAPQIVLITDQWLSPISRHASRVFALPVGVDTAWDSYTAPLALIEAAVVMVSERDWNNTRLRIEAWDRLRINAHDPATPLLLEGSTHAS